ncbi:uncharacterized protein LOC131631685 isoform X2 [Vicia villosa]|uniref:uncharacterized protein LOC131631685 isoform X2 n=1 Tax=Vicia villosa TaxID=3911 RepID=UPI00273C0797|nr:uncharacterized protein LOC131631685 isoform X2 [Vicia villosa]
MLLSLFWQTQWGFEKMTHMLTQIWRWLVQPEVWRFVGFASAVVGLVSYALSSSFNYLFGSWNLLKVFLYCIFSFFISLMIFFAKLLQHSTSLRFKAHTAFLVLAITSAYSFFFDKKVNGKPDLYSLISYAAFAIMSLSLSRQTHFGFEIDLLYFFLGCLIVLLMKIKLQLFFVGAGFSYSLIILRSSFSSIDAGANNPHSDLQNGNSVVLSIASLQLTSTDTASATSSANNSSIGSPQLVITADISNMMEQLQTFVTELRRENSNFIQMVLEYVKKYVEEYSELVVTDTNFMMDALKPETIKGLEETAKVMMSSGFEKDFSDVYIDCRRECLNECLMHRLFGLQKLSIEDIHNMPWNVLEAQIEKWIKTFNITLKILFPGERRICDRIFFGSSSAADFSFVEICRESTIQLLSFAQSVASGSHSPDRLFKMLEVLETLRDLIPEIESFFCDEYSVSLRNEANTTRKKLEEAIRDIFIQLEEFYRQEHRYLESLESNLNARSKFYDGSFSGDIFLMNNGTYIIPIAEDNELGSLLENDWIRQYAWKVLHYNGQQNMSTISPELTHEVNVKDSEAFPCQPRDSRRHGSTLEEEIGFKYPRSMYRCYHMKQRACRAKKSIQQLGDNPNVFEIIYYHGHSCNTPLIRPASQSGTPAESINTIHGKASWSCRRWVSSYDGKRRMLSSFCH